MHIITTTDDLVEFCNACKSAPFITVDTEFMREKTYFAQLCLIQVATSHDHAAIIDPLAKGLELAPLFKLFKNPKIVKVFHAARQDIEIFYKMMQTVPWPIFDTQIAAMACGYGDQIGYDALVKLVLKQTIDKGSRFTDWSRRPLSDSQLNYALGDVTYLADVYTKMQSKLQREERQHWVAEEMESQRNPELYHVMPELAWKRLKMRNPKRRELGPLMKLAQWREEEAQKKDMPRARLLKDDAIFELGRQQPKDIDGLKKLRSIHDGFANSYQGKAVLEMIKQGQSLPDSALPETSKPVNKKQMPVDVLELLRVLLKHKSEKFNVAPRLIANASDLDELAREEDANIPALKGWRYDVFGEDALKLKQGKLAMTLVNDELKVFESK